MQPSATILLVDDEKDFRDCVRGLFELHGFHVEEACNGLDALEKVKDKKYDAILTDLFMPRMSGKKFIHEARQMENGRTLIMAMTGSIEDYVWDGVIELVDAKIPKPFTDDMHLDFLRPRLSCA